ncbi:transketolase [Lederbergia ruris]|uniref:Transketolase n=1 Tax=Lederbergia ruris TaxID=217495 RepID=A0ABQ4KN88_9BACI|nr:transketolase family protein [Lederbergia ruris]GIN59406.1 transketolase [Lederbergia ruris]
MANELSGREGFGQALLELGKENKRVVALCADLAESVKVHHFAEQYPERYFQIGIAEQDMIGTAAGMALSDLVPFATTYAVFAAQRANEQIRLAVCYNQANVKIAVSHAGLTVGEDGATHQALEDIASMRAMPNMTVIVPADAEEAYHATKASAEMYGPVYLRLGRTPVPVITNGSEEFKIGKARKLRNGKDATIIACGIMVEQALIASEKLEMEGISVSVINMHTIKPIDKEIVIEEAKRTGCIVTAEEHSVIGGLGGAVSEVLSENYPVPIIKVGTKDTFGESGPPNELLEKYKLTSKDIVEATKKSMTMKKEVVFEK